MSKSKITLLLTGQFERNLYTNDFLKIIEFQRKIFKFDSVICHLWNEEYEKIKHLPIPEYVTIINDDDLVPFNKSFISFISEDEHKFHAESILISQNQVGMYDVDEMMPVAFTSLKQLYAMSKVYDYALHNVDSDIFIRSRYDNHYLYSPNYLQLKEYLNSSRPIVFVPRTHINYSLLDHFYIMNMQGLKSFKDYFNTCRNYSFNQRVFWSENCFRYHANNANKIVVYRFNFPCYVHRWFKDTGQFNSVDCKLSQITRDIKPFKPGNLRSADYVL